jgi:hypothetical protein
MNTNTASTPTTAHPAWCDPRSCCADEQHPADRRHVATELEVTQTLVAPYRDLVTAELHPHLVRVALDQRAGADEPRVGIVIEQDRPHAAEGWAELTVDEAEALARALLRQVARARGDSGSVAVRVGQLVALVDTIREQLALLADGVEGRR